MPRESGIRQRGIVGRRIAFADSELITKYTLPFMDATWRVAFVVLDLLGSPPRIVEATVHADGSRLRTPARTSELRRIESVPREHLDALAHYDPWWAFRGVAGIDRSWIETIFATNIARPFVQKGKTYKIHDLRFEDGLRRLEAVIAKDDVFRVMEFHPGDIDLLGLRSKPRPTQEFRNAETAKAL